MAPAARSQAVEVEFDGGKRRETFHGQHRGRGVRRNQLRRVTFAQRQCSHPSGLANSSDLVGRNFMFHKAAIVLSIGLKPNPSKYMKTVAVHDFYFGEKEFPFRWAGFSWSAPSSGK